MSNPFEEIKTESDLTQNLNIEIWVETYGRKKTTWISGWNISMEKLKNHLKNIKIKNGCNGTIKNKDSLGKIIEVVQLQGDHVDFMIEYLTSNGVDSSSIIIKG